MPDIADLEPAAEPAAVKPSDLGSAAEPAGDPAPIDRLAHLRWGLAASVALLVAGLPIAWLALGWAGLWGFAAGVGLVVASYSVSSLVIAWADSADRALIMPFGLVTYAAKFAAIVALLAAVDGSGWQGHTPMGMGIIAAAIGWSAAQITWVVRTQHPYCGVQHRRRRLSS